MSLGWIIAIIIVALAIILSNIMLLKQTAHQKMPSLKDLEQQKKEQAPEANSSTSSSADHNDSSIQTDDVNKEKP